MEDTSQFEIAFDIARQELFTLDEVAKWCGMTRTALYQHYRRGHIKPELLQCHRLYFSRNAINDFVTNYRPVL